MADAAASLERPRRHAAAARCLGDGRLAGFPGQEPSRSTPGSAVVAVRHPALQRRDRRAGRTAASRPWSRWFSSRSVRTMRCRCRFSRRATVAAGSGSMRSTSTSTGEILGQRNTRRNGVTRRRRFPILGLHFQLLAGEWGRWAMGIAALVWLITSIIGLALSWPGVWLRLRSWRPIPSARMKGGALLRTTTHRASGLWLLPVLTALARSHRLRSICRSSSGPIAPSRRSLRSRRAAGQHPKSRWSLQPRRRCRAEDLPEAKTNNIFRLSAAGGIRSTSICRRTPIRRVIDFALRILRPGEVTALRRGPGPETTGDRFMAWLYPGWAAHRRRVR